MSYQSYKFRKECLKSDTLRDSTLTEPSDVTAIKNINYAGNNDKYNLMDIYFPKGTEGKLPVIISIHGGGFVYGTKEIYKFYGMYLASLGFTVVNFNYHLAPRAKFPTPLVETNKVIEFCIAHADEYHLDMNNTFIVGDSAGAQDANQYAVIYSNNEYAKHFPFKVPEGFKLRAVGLNCGIYDFDWSPERVGLMKDYVGKEDKAKKKYGEMLYPLKYINENYPPAFVMTAVSDFLREKAEPMYNLFKSHDIEAECKCYGEEGQEYMCHVCHVNMNLAEAKIINTEETDFFKKFME